MFWIGIYEDQSQYGCRREAFRQDARESCVVWQSNIYNSVSAGIIECQLLPFQSIDVKNPYRAIGVAKIIRFKASVNNLLSIRAPIKILIRTIKCKLSQIIDRKSTRLNSSHGYISYAVF